MGTVLKIFGGIMLVVLGFLLYMFADIIPLQGPLGFIIKIAMIAGGITLIIKGSQ